MKRQRGFTVLELAIAAALFAGIVTLALAWLLAQQRFASATGALLERTAARPPMETLLRQDIQAAAAVLPAWQGLASTEDMLILAIPVNAYGYRTDQATIVLYAPAGNRLLRAFFPTREADRAGGAPRWVGPELPVGRTVHFEYLDTEGNSLLGAVVANTRQVVITLPAVPGQPAAELRVHLRNTLP